MEQGFYRVDLRINDPRKNDSIVLFVPLDADGGLDSEGEGPPFLFRALWDGENWAGEFKPTESGNQNRLVWLGGGIEGGECQTDLLTVPLRTGSLVSVVTSEGSRIYRVVGLRKVLNSN